MEIVLTVAVVVVLLGTTAGMVLALPAAWAGIRPQWLRASPAARRRGVIAGGLTLTLGIAAGTLVILAPWGPSSVLYVLGALGAISIVLTHIAVIAELVQARNRLRHRRTERL